MFHSSITDAGSCLHPLRQGAHRLVIGVLDHHFVSSPDIHSVSRPQKVERTYMVQREQSGQPPRDTYHTLFSFFQFTALGSTDNQGENPHSMEACSESSSQYTKLTSQLNIYRYHHHALAPSTTNWVEGALKSGQNKGG